MSQGPESWLRRHVYSHADVTNSICELEGLLHSFGIADDDGGITGKSGILQYFEDLHVEQRDEQLGMLAHWLETRLEREAGAIDVHRLQVENEANSGADKPSRRPSRRRTRSTEMPSSTMELLGSGSNGGDGSDGLACSVWTAAEEAMAAHGVLEELDNLEAKSSVALNSLYQKLRMLMLERRAQLEAGLGRLATSVASIGSVGDAAATAQVQTLLLSLRPCFAKFGEPANWTALKPTPWPKPEPKWGGGPPGEFVEL